MAWKIQWHYNPLIKKNSEEEDSVCKAVHKWILFGFVADIVCKYIVRVVESDNNWWVLLYVYITFDKWWHAVSGIKSSHSRVRTVDAMFLLCYRKFALSWNVHVYSSASKWHRIETLASETLGHLCV